MAKTTPAGLRWAKWLNSELIARDMRPKDLTNASAQKLSSDIISKWRKGEFNVDSTTALTVAAAFGIHPSVVLRAGGYDELADLSIAAAPQELTADPIDPTIRKIMEDGRIPDAEKPRVIKLYLRDVEAARQRVEEISEIADQAARRSGPSPQRSEGPAATG